MEDGTTSLFGQISCHWSGSLEESDYFTTTVTAATAAMITTQSADVTGVRPLKKALLFYTSRRITDTRLNLVRHQDEITSLRAIITSSTEVHFSVVEIASPTPSSTIRISTPADMQERIPGVPSPNTNTHTISSNPAVWRGTRSAPNSSSPPPLSATSNPPSSTQGSHTTIPADPHSLRPRHPPCIPTQRLVANLPLHANIGVPRLCPVRSVVVPRSFGLAGRVKNETLIRSGAAQRCARLEAAQGACETAGQHVSLLQTEAAVSSREEPETRIHAGRGEAVHNSSRSRCCVTYVLSPDSWPVSTVNELCSTAG
ncbi:hypothetical protein C7974DRAFT_375535 [Boeremia exigua]|uniref:uncharacterized protein n=1 Tax=Boeremia exigua TaxID=749465 RepID=UPI001E8EB89A|nr:uncharacterized protein C7974DRAFT_375535 [Boeremia exigua]KAH6633453.1 hypothetical protein C7974DRAFT_375535 [Boeremia exigua]